MFHYNFLITVPESAGDGEQIIGGCGLHRRGDRATIEIGYWLRPDAVGRGLMTAVARALTATTFTLDGITQVAIRCDAANERSTRRSPSGSGSSTSGTSSTSR